MKDIIGLSEEDFFQWVKLQLEKRGISYSNYSDKETVWKELYEILFLEQEITTEEIEQFFIPFGQAGYMSTRLKFEIMLFVLEKDYGSSWFFLEGAGNCQAVTAADICDLYLQWAQEGRLYLSEEEKREFFIQNLVDQLGLGVFEVLKRVAPEGVLIGELCPPWYEKEPVEERIAVYSCGTVIRLPFLAMKNKEEMIGLIRQMLVLENRGELTVLEPILDFVREDGTCITAVRPPAGMDWGIRILYGASRKEELRWKN